ncbi:hypothetical protein PUN28_003566 [Cardiocondyla obscurior]
MTSNINETTKNLNSKSHIDDTSQNATSDWWKNLEVSDNEHISSNSKHTHSAEIAKSYILQTSTSESEKEINVKKKKVHLQANTRKSSKNAFSNVLNDEVTIPLKSLKKQARSNLYRDSNKEVLQENVQKDEEDNFSPTENILTKKKKVHLQANTRKSSNNAFSNVLNDEVTIPLKSLKKQARSNLYKDSDEEILQEKIQKDGEDNSSSTENILKKKPRISRRRKKENTKDQNPFEDVLTEENDNSNSRNKSKSVMLGKQSLERLMDENINISKDYTTRRKSMKMSRATSDSLNLLPSNVEKKISESNSNENVSSTENDINVGHNKKSKSRFLHTRRSLGKNIFAEILTDDSSISSPVLNRDEKTDIHQSSLAPQPLSSPNKSVDRSKKSKIDISHEHKSKNSLLNASKQLVNEQIEDNSEQKSSASLDNESHRKKSTFLKPNLRQSLRKKKNEKVFKETGTSSARKSNIFTENNDTFSEQEIEIATEINQESGRALSVTKKNSNVNNSSSAEESFENIFMNVSNSKSVATLEHQSKSENDNLIIKSKATSRKNVTETSERDIVSSRKSIREETLKKHSNINEDLDNDVESNIEEDLNEFEEVSKSDFNKKARLTRSSLKNRSETPKSAKKEIHKNINKLHNDENSGYNLNMSKQISKSNSDNKTRFTRSTLKNQSTMSTSANVEVSKIINNVSNNLSNESDSSLFQKMSKSHTGRQAHFTRSTLKNQSETSKRASKHMESSGKSLNADNIDNVDNLNENSEINTDVDNIISSTRISNSYISTTTHKNTIPSAKISTINEENSALEVDSVERNFTPANAKSSNKILTRSSIRETSEIASTKKSLDKFQNRSTPSKKASSRKDISFNTNKQQTFKIPRKINDFFKVKQASTSMDKSSNTHAQESQIFDEKMERIKKELEGMKTREMAAMKINTTNKNKSELKVKSVKIIMKKKSVTTTTKTVHKAYLVNGEVYKQPRLPRPKYWVTNRLYKFLWNRMEQKYQFSTRIKSEKFVQGLAEVVAYVDRSKKYEKYQSQINALMKEMARLGIVSTRSDFYHFCQDFLPYEFRVKVVPMLMPGNKINVPYDPDKLHVPILSPDN